jgi:hypothetical protein
MKSIGSFAKYTLLAIWIIAIALTISIGINKHQPLLLTEELKKRNININPT